MTMLTLDAERWRKFAEHAQVVVNEDGGLIIYACLWSDYDLEDLPKELEPVRGLMAAVEDKGCTAHTGEAIALFDAFHDIEGREFQAPTNSFVGPLELLMRCAQQEAAKHRREGHDVSADALRDALLDARSLLQWLREAAAYVAAEDQDPLTAHGLVEAIAAGPPAMEVRHA